MSVQITHRVVTYLKRPKGDSGITQLGSKRISTPAALDWILDLLPEGTVTVDYADDAPECVIRIKREGLDAVQ